MNKNIKLAVQFLIVAGIAFFLSACHSDKPSDSEAKAAVEQQLAGCKYFSVSDFDKVNGVPQNDGNYVVDVKYTVKMAEPDSDLEDSIKAQKKIGDKITAIQSDYSDSMAKSNEEHAKFVAEHASDPDREAEFQQGGDPYLKDRQDMLLQIQQLREQLQSDNGVLAYQRRIEQTCSGIKTSIYGSFFSGRVTYDQMLDGAKLDFTGQVAMVNTDNGWVLAQ